MEEDRIKRSIVRVLKRDGKTAGTGFVAHATGLLVTCAHVVKLAQAGPGETVELMFDAVAKKLTASVVPRYWRDPDEKDVAILRLEEQLPDTAQPLPLGRMIEASGTAFKTFGFPERQQQGMWGYGTIGNHIQHPTAGALLQLTSAEVTTGFSGAPIIDEITSLVVGMVSEITRPDEYMRLGTTALATTTPTLLTACPALQPTELCPYRGLTSFTSAHARFFFGRKQVVEKLLASLRNEPSFLTLMGPSGVGKSSVIQAGLIPQLREGKVLHSENWGFIVTSRYDEPYAHLEASGLSGASEDFINAVETWLTEHAECGRLVLVMDQFEKLFLDCPEPLQSDFCEHLTQLLNAPSPVTIILVMQDAYYRRLTQQAPELATYWLPESWNDIPQDIWTLDKEDVTAIIREPTKRVGLSFEGNLDEVIINDVMAAASPENEEGTVQSTILPLLESTLTRLWELRQDGVLRRRAYSDIVGGLTGQLPRWADTAFRNAGDELQPVYTLILTSLVDTTQGDQHKIGIPQRAPLRDLPRSEEDAATVLRVVQQLTEARLLVTYGDKQSGQETIELIDEALLHKWTRLKRLAGTESRRFRHDPAAGSESQSNRDTGRISSSPTELEGEPQDDTVPPDSGGQETVLKDYDRQISDLFCNRGLELAKQERFEEAVEAINNALSLICDDLMKGLALTNLNRHEEALKVCHETLRSKPGDPLAWYTKGLVLKRLGRDEAALDTFKETYTISRRQLGSTGKGPEDLGSHNGSEEE
jgi:tetratricopeptide (TPR) repeat protein